MWPASNLHEKSCPIAGTQTSAPFSVSMPSSLYLPLQASTGGASTAAAASSFRLSRLCAASSQLWRSQVWLPPLSPHGRHRATRLACVCETAVEIDGVPSTEGVNAVTPAIGSRIRVSKPLTVFHVPKHPNFDLQGYEGELKDVLKSWKGKPISANLPYKVQFILDLDGKQVKFFAHFKEDEFEVV